MIAEGAVRNAALDAGLDDAAIWVVPVEPAGDAVGWEASVPIYPASMIKTPLAVAAAVAVADGRLDWPDPLTVEVANMTFNDAPSPLIPGAQTTLEDVVALMIAHSDNVATNMVIDCLGRERATADLAVLGFSATAIRRKLSGTLPLIADPEATGRNVHPAREACELFSRIARNGVPGAVKIRTALAAQMWNTKLSAGLAQGDRFAHKTGDTDEVSHDGGVLTLESGQCFAIAVYTQLASSDNTDERFATFMRALRPLLVRAGRP